MIEHSQLDIALRHLLRLKPLEGVEGEERLEVTVFAVDDWRHHIGPVNHIDFRQDALTMHQSNIFQVHFVPEGGLEKPVTVNLALKFTLVARNLRC